MKKVLRFSLVVCTVVALSAAAAAAPKKPPGCRDFNGNGSDDSQVAARRAAKDDLNQKIANLKQKQPGKVKLKGKAKIACSGNDCKVSQRICLTDFDNCPDPEECW
jgi:Spy/CpxP family protein refolding chaperone